MKKSDNGDNLVYNDQIVEMLSQAIYRGAGALKYVPELVKELIVENRWQKRLIRRTGEEKIFLSFEEFVKTEPLEGLGTDIETLRSLCINDPEVMRMIDILIENSSTDLDSNPYVLSILKKTHPELVEKVLNAEITLRQAVIEAGFQERRTRLLPANLDDMAEKIFNVLKLEWGKNTPEALDELIKQLARYRR